jgi:hypothetical protein
MAEAIEKIAKEFAAAVLDIIEQRVWRIVTTPRG